jgi:hypothetical protein
MREIGFSQKRLGSSPLLERNPPKTPPSPQLLAGAVSFVIEYHWSRFIKKSLAWSGFRRLLDRTPQDDARIRAAL